MKALIAPVVLVFLVGCSQPTGSSTSTGKPYTGKLRIDAGTEYVLEESPSTVGGACAGWKTVSLQKPGQPATGMRELLCWRLVGDTVEVTSRDGQQTPPAKRGVFTD